MKRGLSVGFMVLAISVVATAFADDFYSSLYLGAQVGYADLHYNSGWLTGKSGFTSVKDVDSKGVAGRVFLGYDISKYVAGEMGYLLLQDVQFSGINGTYNNYFNQAIVDLFAKFTLPIGNRFGFFAKGGVAYVRRSDMTVTTSVSYAANNKFAPAASAGLFYWLNQSWALDASAFRYFETGDFKPTDFFALGLTYQF